MTTIAIAGLAGCAAAGIFLCVCRCWPCSASAERSWFDRPPLAFRLLWPVLRVFEFRGLATHRLGRVDAQLATAGLEYRLRPVELVALQRVLASCVLAPVSIATGGTLDSTVLMLGVSLAGVGWSIPQLWLSSRARHRQQEILVNLPYALELVMLSIEAGHNLAGGLLQAQRRLPPSALKDELARVLRDTRAGRTRVDALRAFALRVDDARLRQLVSALHRAEQCGGSVVDVLRVRTEALRQERFRDAERRALEAPVKLILPLVLFVFPTTFVVLGFLMVSKAITAGMIDHPVLVWAARWPGT